MSLTSSTQKIYPVLLAGGSGTRLWPTSRKSYPKQFSKLVGDHSLFQQSALRLVNCGDLEFQAPIIVTNNDFRFIVAEQLQALGIDPGAILIEPEPRNTAPAILAAVEHIGALDPEALVLVMPSDHLVPDVMAFVDCVGSGIRAALDGNIVTFGVQPSRPETGYGYIECSFGSKDGAASVTSFVEKPDAATAERYLRDGNYFWNSGIFLFRASDFRDAVKQYCPDLLQPVASAVENSEEDIGFLRLAAEPWGKCPDISVDYAVMERAGNVSAVRFVGEWSDLGGWDAIWEAGDPDKHGVAANGEVTIIDCSNSLLRSDDPSVHLVGLGLDNIVAVATRDAVLVAHKDRSQDVKLVVSELTRRGIKQAQQSTKDHRPWGWFESLALGDRFQVKRIHVNPGAALSLQSHHHRSEHWIVVEGTARVTVNDDVRLVTEGQSIYIPLGATHRMENPGKLPMTLVEVQTGAYLGEDDIVRYQDVYSRS
ncbi:mannose-1-phosphate guanylyltransferase/mannose-6-phosphate isomerase [Roseobacter sp. HKCCA2468]|uniref:mannose-1-phosphate guanylyltransferase/mannose-6-phosphate isomerase n=1 Tax=Roseobacter sp. HKCCA2468 TaxID=3120342 RepID=UPI0030EBEFF2